MVKKLVRSESDRLVAGVCGGLGEYFELDPALFRVLFLVVGLLGGTGVLLYILLWIILPSESEFRVSGNKRIDTFKKEAGDVVQYVAETATGAFRQNVQHKPNRARYVFAIGFIVIGGLFLLNNFIPQVSFGMVWPVALVALGVWLMWRAQPEDTTKSVEEEKEDEPSSNEATSIEEKK